MTDSKIQKEINLLSFSNKKDMDKEKKILTESYRCISPPCCPTCGDCPTDLLLKCPEGLLESNSINQASCSISSCMIL